MWSGRVVSTPLLSLFVVLVSLSGWWQGSGVEGFDIITNPYINFLNISLGFNYSLWSSPNNPTLFNLPNPFTYTGIASSGVPVNSANSLYGLNLYKFGPYNFAPFIGQAMLGSTAILCNGRGANVNTSGPTLPYTNKILVVISEVNGCHPEQLITAAWTGGAKGVLFFEVFYPSSIIGFITFQQWESTSVSDAANTVPFLVVPADYIKNYGIILGHIIKGSPVFLQMYPTSDSYYSFFTTGPFFAMARVCWPIWAFAICIVAFYRWYGFFRQQGFNWFSIAQWTLALEIIGNVLRGTGFILSLNTYALANYYLDWLPDGFCFCSLLLAATFWGTLDTNSSPLYRFRVPLIFVCLSYLIILVCLIQEEVYPNPASWAETMSNITACMEGAMACLVMLFVLRRVFQLMRLRTNQVEEVKGTSLAGDEADKESLEAEEAEAGRNTSSSTTSNDQMKEAQAVQVQVQVPSSPRTGQTVQYRPVVKKMIYWTILIAIGSIAMIVHLICIQVYNNQGILLNLTQSNINFGIAFRGVCPLVASTTQMMFLVPRKYYKEVESRASSSQAPSVGQSSVRRFFSST